MNDNMSEIKRLDAKIGRLRAINAELLAALRTITDHHAGVMGGPVMQAAGIQFANGVEGIPTILKARAAITKAGG